MRDRYETQREASWLVFVPCAARCSSAAPRNSACGRNSRCCSNTSVLVLFFSDFLRFFSDFRLFIRFFSDSRFCSPFERGRTIASKKAGEKRAHLCDDIMNHDERIRTDARISLRNTTSNLSPIPIIPISALVSMHTGLFSSCNLHR